LAVVLKVPCPRSTCLACFSSDCDHLNADHLLIKTLLTDNNGFPLKGQRSLQPARPTAKAKEKV